MFALSTTILAQKDSIKSTYWEDQLYIQVTYNTLFNQPDDVASSDFSYGISFGYIKDIPLNKKNTFAAGIGIGYDYNLFTHDLVLDNTEFSIDSEVSSNRLKTHNIEFPIQLRWRTSDAVNYSFWRVYAGVRLSYNLFNKHSYTLNDQNVSYNNIDTYNKFQTGLELSVGYGAFTLYTYYGLSSIYENVSHQGNDIETKILKLGLIFYLL